MSITILHGDCRHKLQEIAERSVQCVVSSPPYYGLRRYSDDPRDLGFAPSCACPDNTGSAASIVLDPFAGSGTVLRVAARYQRNAIGIELNQTYIEEHVEKRTDGLQVEMFV